MKIDLILIGNELLNAKIKDLNTYALSKALFSVNHELRKVHIIGDNESDFHQALTEAQGSSDCIITSGGLGPTKDDLTKYMLGKFFQRELIYSSESEQIVERQFTRGKKVYLNKKYHYHEIPKDFSPLYNPVGYAPGLFYKNDSIMVFALPGVPIEFDGMINNAVIPALPKSEFIEKHIIVRTYKIPEARIFSEVAPKLWDQLQSIGEVSSLPQLLGVDIGVKIQATTQDEINKKEKKILNIFEDSPLKESIWHIGPELLEEVIIQKAKAKSLTIGFAESCTGGLLASRITDISGSSSVFWGSIVSYANEVKIKSLDVSEETLNTKGAVSKETALAMAIGTKKNLLVDIAVTTTGIAGPGGATKEKPVGTVGIGVKSSETEFSDLFYFQGDREVLKKKFSEAALFTLLFEIDRVNK